VGFSSVLPNLKSAIALVLSVYTAHIQWLMIEPRRHRIMSADEVSRRKEKKNPTPGLEPGSPYPPKVDLFGNTSVVNYGMLPVAPP
jgi:hypothetical protein